jgi:2-dehydro-3-deoxyphosphooctonate aldolase (KDO 8-P synthase)
MKRTINIISDGKTINLLNNQKLFLISGPCVVEGETITRQIAEKIKRITSDLEITFIFKASYKKANRTSGSSFRSIGVQNSLDILKKIREDLRIPVLTDIHSELEATIASEYVDILQIPAFLSRQTELLEAAGETGRIINIKKGQFLSPEDMHYQIKKVESTGNRKILVTERGTSFGYHNLVVDMRALSIMKKFSYPVVFDATHSLQMPSGAKGVSGGSPEFIYPLARAAAAAGINGIFIETHPHPEKALSDARSMLPLSQLEQLLLQLIEIHQLVYKFRD